jgi:proteasome activator subunit 4
LFLPIDEKQHFTTSPDEYLPTLFSLWSMFTGSATVDSMFTALMSRVAEANIAKKDGLFTSSQVKTVFTAGLRMMNLPVGSRSDGGGSGAGASGGTTTGYGSHGVRNDMKAGSALMLLKKSVSIYIKGHGLC